MNSVHVVRERNIRSVMASTSKTSQVLKKLKMLTVSVSIFFVMSPGPRISKAALPQQSQELKSAIDLIQESRCEDALKILSDLTQRNPNDSQAWFYLGVASVKTMRVKAGADALRKSIDLDSSFAPAHTFLSDALLQLGALPEAAREAERASQLDPIAPEPYYQLAFARFRQGSMEDTVHYAELAISTKPDFAPAYLLKAQALIGLYRNAGPVADELLKEKLVSRYRQAADTLAKYVEMVPESEDRSLWAQEIEVLRNFSFTDNSALTTREVDTKVRIIAKPEPTYSEEARRYQVVGRVTLRATFDVDGTVRNVLVVQALPCGLTEGSEGCSENSV
jgi:tetratricopeptide (TPR) repeat protein